MQTWAERQAELAALLERQIFFVGGAPRSGTTWLQQLLDAHPDVSCRGEGLFANRLAGAMDRLVAEQRQALEAKNAALFAHTGGYPLPAAGEADMLIATAVLMGLHQQCAGASPRAIGEKTPENVFFFARIKQVLPGAKLIAIARDPRDLLSSAWHFFHRAQMGENVVAAKFDFIRGALPSIGQGVRSMIEVAKVCPQDTLIVTYEALSLAPERPLAQLFRFLGVSDDASVVADCIARNRFPTERAARGAFHNRGVVGDWRTTLSPEMNELVLRELGWMFPSFGWAA